MERMPIKTLYSPKSASLSWLTCLYKNQKTLREMKRRANFLDLGNSAKKLLSGVLSAKNKPPAKQNKKEVSMVMPKSSIVSQKYGKS